MEESAVTERFRRGFITAADAPSVMQGGISSRYMRLHHTLVAWSDVGSADVHLEQESSHEILVLLPDAGAVLTANGARATAPPRSICILPPGSSRIAPTAPGRIIRLFTPPPEALLARAINRDDYVDHSADVLRPIDTPFIRKGAAAIRIYSRDEMVGAPGRPRCVQTGNMSIIWIERNGARRTQLGPHSHADYEEGALVIAGDYVQHLRTPWGEDAGLWCDDEHVVIRPGTVSIVPPGVIHAAEAIGAGNHIMINIYAPVRDDHIRNGLMVNADEYERTAQ